MTPILLSGIGAAKLILIWVNFFDALQDPTVGDDSSNTYQHLTLYGANSAACHRLHYCINPTTSGSFHVTSAGSNCYQWVYAQAWSADGAVSFDQSSGTSGVGVTQVQAASLTPSQAGALALSGASLQTESGLTYSNWPSQDANEITQPSAGNYVGGAYGYDAQGAAAAFQPIWSWNGSSLNAAMTNAVFLEAQGTPPAMGGRFHRIVTRPAAFRPGIAR